MHSVELRGEFFDLLAEFVYLRLNLCDTFQLDVEFSINGVEVLV